MNCSQLTFQTKLDAGSGKRSNHQPGPGTLVCRAGQDPHGRSRRCQPLKICDDFVQGRGNRPVTDVQPREAELWLKQLDLSPKSRSHIRLMLRTLVDFAMWSGIIEVARNPVDLVRMNSGKFPILLQKKICGNLLVSVVRLLSVR